MTTKPMVALFLLMTGAIGAMTGAVAGFAAEPLEVVSRAHSSQVSDTPVYAAPGSYSPSPVSLSADGRYAVFLSVAPNLSPGQEDVNQNPAEPAADVFLADLVTGAVTLVSHSLSSPSTTGEQGSREAVISADGRYVAFISSAIDLAPGQEETDHRYPYEYDVLLWDRVTGTTTLVADSQQEDAYFSGLTISADGRYLAFASDAFDLIPGRQGGDGGDVYLYDRVEKALRLVSHLPGQPNTATSDGGSGEPRISADGRFIVFRSTAGDLAPGQVQNSYSIVLYDRTTGALSLVGPGDGADISANGKVVAFSMYQNLMLYDRETRQTVTVSDTALGTNGGNTDRSFALSADGRYTAFLIVEGGYSRKVAVYDRVSRATTLASRPPGPFSPEAGARGLTISADGRYVAFASTDPAWVPGQVDATPYAQFGWDVFLFDRSAGKTSLVSRLPASGVTTANGDSYSPVISANGSRVAFYSEATNLVAGLKDHNDSPDLFAWEAATQSNRAVTVRDSSRPSQSPAAESLGRSMSADGRYIAFESTATNLVAGQVDGNREEDVFLYDAVAKTTVLVSRTPASPGTTATSGSSHPVVSADGRYVAFYSSARNLVPGANPGASDSLFLFDRVASTVTFVARVGSFTSSEENSQVRFSADGRWLAFSSSASDVIPGQQENSEFPDDTVDVFLWDRTTGGTLLVSRSAAGPTVTGNAPSLWPAVSADGRYVAFLSGATDLITGQIDGDGEYDHNNIFLFDRITGGTTLVSHVHGSAVTSAGADAAPAISADGKYIAFSSETRDLDPGVSPRGGSSIYIYDRILGSHQRAGFNSHARTELALSADGGILAFASSDSLISDTFFGGTQIYLYDRGAKSLTLVSRDASIPSQGGRGDSTGSVISSDGRYTAYMSDAPNLIAGEIRAPRWDGPDVFLFDRVTGTTTLLSRWKGSPVAAAGDSFLPMISANGRQVAFTSDSDLVAGDANLRRDVYLFNFDPVTPGGPVTVPPCLLFDTRRPADGPAMRSNVARVVKATGVCGVPATAKRVAVKVTAFQETGKGNLRFYPGDLAAPSTGILRFSARQTRSGTFDLPVAGNGTGTLTILPFVAGPGTTGVSVEVTGYTP